MKKLLGILLCLLIIMLSASDYVITAATRDEPAVFSDSSGLYLISYSGKHADITCYGDHDTDISLNLNDRIDAVSAAFGRAVFFSSDAPNNQVVVAVYDIAYDSIDTFAIYGLRLYSDTSLCCDRDFIYIENQQNAREVKVYRYDGTPSGSANLPGDVSDLTNDFNNDAYAVANNELFALTGSASQPFDGTKVRYPLSAVDDRAIISKNGDAYILNGNRIIRTIKVNPNAGACVIDGILYVTDDDMIYGYSINTGEKVCSRQLDFICQMVYSRNGRIICIENGAAVSLDRSSFKELRSSQGIDKAQYNDSFGISSDQYKIDHQNRFIYDIPAGTSLSAFRSHIDHYGYSMAVYQGGEEKTNGNIGTAMTAAFGNGADSVSYELSVRGDLTGEGKVNSRDLNELMDALVGAVDFNGVYPLSADLSGNNAVDAADVVLMKQSIS